jgi:hypothetical protein
MQYTGRSYIHGGFVGQAMQDGRLHTFCKVSGRMADPILYYLSQNLTSLVRYTRVDLQITIPLPDWHSARILKDYMEASNHLAELIEGKAGLDTVYIGSRKSSHFWRIYVKESENKDRFLRFEVEIKHDRDKIPNRLIYEIKKHGRKASDSHFWDRLKKLSLPREYMQELKMYMSSDTSPLPHVARDTGQKKFRWLDNTVRKAILNFAASAHGRDEFTKDWLLEIIMDISGTCDIDLP